MKIFVRFLIVLSALSLIAAFAILFSIYNSDAVQQDVVKEKTFGLEFAGIDITANNVRIDLLPSENNTTRIKLTGDSDNLTLNTDILGKRLIVSVEEQSRFFSFGLSRSHLLQVYIPADGIGSLAIDSRNGAIHAGQIQATDILLEADNGRITIEAVETDIIHVETVNGVIEITDIDADITARSSNGRILIRDVFGDLRAQTNNGRIELTVTTLDFPIDLKTNNGRIEIHTEKEPINARIQARVDNGRLDIFGRDSDQVNFGRDGVLIKLASKNGSIILD